MGLVDRLAFTCSRLQHERARRRLLAIAGDDPVRRIHSAAWPGGARLRAPWCEQRIVVFDTEATGLDPNVGEAVSLGAVSMEHGRIVLGDTFDRIIASEASPSRQSILVHGITPDKVAAGDDPARVLREFLAWAADAVLVAHHAAFDLALLDRIACRSDAIGMPMQSLVLDTVRLARRVERSGSVRYDLDSLLDRYEVPVAGGRHTAIGDALLTARLLQKLLKRLAARGVRTLAELALPGPGPRPRGIA